MSIGIRVARPVALVAVMAVALLGTACSDDEPDDATPDTTASTTDSADGTVDPGETEDGSGGDGIVAEGFAFTSVTAAPGAEVQVSNQDSARHTVTADDGEFDSGEIDGGGAGSITAPDQPGDYAFHCEIHPDMTGTLTVEA